MNFSGLKRQQLYPCTVCTIDGFRWPVSYFTHDLTWRAHQVVHAGDSALAQGLERLRGQKVEAKASVLSLESCLRRMTSTVFPFKTTDLSTLMGIILSLMLS